MAPELGITTQMMMADPLFADIMWKMTPASLAVRLSQGRWQAWPYVQLLSRKLVDVAMGRCKRLIVVMPPRHGKSEMVSHWLPVWYLENFPRNRVILCSYEADFAAKWGGKARDTVASNQEHLTLRFKTNKPAMHHWDTSEGGAMMTAGVGGPITGKGANLFIIDDFVKNSEEAGSLTMREKLWDWWLSTARTRLEPDAGVIVMATRWHSDDLIGRIINPDYQSEKGTKEDWEVFCFPLLAEPDAENYYRHFGVKVNDLRSESVISSHKHLSKKELDGWRDMLGRKHGQALCPDRYDEVDASRIRGGCMEKVWFSLYQQRPGDEAADGNVYSSFDEMKHVRPLRRDDRMQLFVAMDFNVDPMSVVIGQYDLGNGMGYTQRLEILEEISLLDSNTPNMMLVLIPRLLEYQRGYTLQVHVFGDAAGTQRGTQSTKTNWQIVADHFALHPNIHYKFLRRKTNPLIRDRVNAVNTMLMAADGTIRMYVDEQKCPELILDFKKVRWDEDSSGNKSGQLDKSDKKRTHISDAAGYAVEYLFSLKTKSGGRKGMMQ